MPSRARAPSAVRLLCLAAAPALAAAQWPWLDNRYFTDGGDQGDDVSWAGLPAESGDGFVTEGETSCSCDLTANACDAFCCCDQQCSDFERSTLFDCEAAEEAAARNLARRGVRMCSDAVVEQNLPDTSLAAWEEDGDDPMQRVLCVVSDNSPSYGDFITPLAPITDETAAQDAVRHNSSFGDLQDEGLPGTDFNSYYEAGQAIRAGTSAGQNADAGDYADILLPGAPGPAGSLCADAAPVRFLETRAPRTCVTVLRDPVAACAAGSTLDASAIAGLSIATSAQRPDSGSYERVSIGLARAEAAQYGGSTRADLTGGVTSPTLVDNGANGTVCEGALIEATLRFKVSNRGEIVSASAYLTVADLDMPAAADSASGSPFRLQRRFGVLFESDDAGDDWRPRSGRPGYLGGLPVLSGREDGDDAIQQATTGLVAMVVRERDGACAFGATPPARPVPGGGDLRAEPVRFLEDAVLACELGWDEAELRRRCQANVQPSLANWTDDWVGRYGDSYGEARADWVEVLTPGSPGSADWDDQQATCENLVVGAHIEILTSRYGAAVDPQRQIIAAILTYRTADWEIRKRPRRFFTVTVAFTDVPAGDAAEFVPPAPGLFAPLPDDVFYPFTVEVDQVQSRAQGAASAAVSAATGARRGR